MSRAESRLATPKCQPILTGAGKVLFALNLQQAQTAALQNCRCLDVVRDTHPYLILRLNRNDGPAVCRCF